MDKPYKRKNYYQKPGRGGGSGGGSWNNSKKKFKHYLTPGMKGFLCTCNMREQDCVKESLNVLNEYADKLYSEVQAPKADEGDIEDELQKEVSQLKDVPRGFEKFVPVDTGVPNNVFIKTTVEEPVKLAWSILKEAAETRVQKGRFLMRIVPVEVTCKANIEDIKTGADALFEKHFRCEPTTFGIVINKRYNNSILRDEVIHALALLVTDRNPEHKANLKEPQKTVLLEIIKGICCLSVLDDYKELKHYNLAELTKPETAEPESAETSDKGTVKEDEMEDEDKKIEEPEDKKIGEPENKNIGEPEDEKEEDSHPPETPT